MRQIDAIDARAFVLRTGGLRAIGLRGLLHAFGLYALCTRAFEPEALRLGVSLGLILLCALELGALELSAIELRTFELSAFDDCAKILRR